MLSYTSCGRGSALGSCLETLSLSSEPANQPAVRATLAGATCRTFTAAGAPGVAWKKDLAGESGAGVFLFTGKATISFANDITLENIPISRVEAVSRLVRPFPPTRRLAAPEYDTRRLLRGCADLKPVGG